MYEFINQPRFIKAIAHVDENFFSKPYSLTPIVDRWFNQLAIVKIKTDDGDERIIEISGHNAQKYMDITLDDQLVSEDDLRRIFFYHSKHSNYEKDIEALEEKLLVLVVQSPPAQTSEIKSLKKEIKAMKDDFESSSRLYVDIVKRGKIALNVERLEQEEGGSVQNIMYRPNHGLMHSVRAACYVTALNDYQKRSSSYSQLSDSDLETLQMMLLFSVVGRRDETGFADSGRGRATYQGFRGASAREYLRYSQQELESIDPAHRPSLEEQYRDAIIVELMGYSNIEQAMEYDKSRLLIDYIIEKQGLTGPDARANAKVLVTQKTITLSTLFPTGSILDKANKQLDLMNLAHGFDLSRCYSLYPKKMSGHSLSSNYVGTMNALLFRNDFLGGDAPTLEKLTDFYDLMKSSFDALLLTGQKTTFGLISKDDFEENKEQLFAQVKKINEQFTDPSQRDILLKSADAARNAPISAGREGSSINYFRSDADDEEELLSEYCDYLVTLSVIGGLTTSDPLLYRQELFDYNHVVDQQTFATDHHKNAIKLVGALTTAYKPSPVSTESQLPKITAVKHHAEKNVVQLVFANEEQATRFADTYQMRFKVDMAPIVKDKKQSSQCSIQVNRNNYQQLVREQLVEFELVKIPAVVSAETDLVDTQDGAMKAIQLIQNSAGLGRLLSTSSKESSDIAEYEYFFNALDDPVNERFSREMNPGTDRSVYHHPRTGEVITRTVQSGEASDLRFQEPITKPGQFEEKRQDWTIRSERAQPKNTIFTKKMAHSLIPPHGKIIPFSGMKSQVNDFFPIGVLSDIKQVDLKSQRYVWSENMVTVKTPWLVDDSRANVEISRQLSTFNDPLEDNDPQENHVLAVENTVRFIVNCLNSKKYRPSDENLTLFIDLAKQQKVNVLKRIPKGSAALEERVNSAYKQLQVRLEQEFTRKHPKYSITIEELIARQRQTNEASPHNEILVANTKGATRALYASKDALFDRLNLALNAMRIKNAHGIDVPLLVLSHDKPPYHYTEAMIKADLIEASNRIKGGDFPYDTRPVYKVNPHGDELKDTNGNPILDENEDGSEKRVVKSLAHQQQVLVDLFQLGTKSELKSIDGVRQGLNPITDDRIIKIAGKIVAKLDLVGGESRERKLMDKVFRHGTAKEKEEVFLRNISLGNQALVKEMLEMDNSVFNRSIDLLTTSIQFSKKNGHSSLTVYLADCLKLLEADNKRQQDGLKDKLLVLKGDGSDQDARTSLLSKRS